MPKDYAPMPDKTRELRNHHLDSSIWNDFTYRDDDIVIAGYPRSGSSWVQQIVGQLLFDGSDDLPVGELSPWVDLRFPRKAAKLADLEAQTHRRFVKTQLPLDALVFNPKARYVFIGRDGRDVAWSLYALHSRANYLWYNALNDTPGRVGPPLDRPVGPAPAYFNEWLNRDGHPFWSFWETVASWWGARSLPNVHLTHFETLKQDLPGEVRKIARFLQIRVNPQSWDTILDHCSFRYMRDNASSIAPLGGAFWEGGATTFLNRGTNGRWRPELGPEDSRRYDDRARQALGPECAAWLRTGKGF